MKYRGHIEKYKKLKKSLSDSLYDWWLDLILKERHPQEDISNLDKEIKKEYVGKLKPPISDKLDSYNTVAKDDFGKVWLRYGKIHHIFDFDFAKPIDIRDLKESIYFEDSLALVEQHIKFKPKERINPEVRKRGEVIQNFSDLYAELEDRVSHNFRYIKYFTQPFRVFERTKIFDNKEYPVISVLIRTHDNITKEGDFSNEFLEQYQRSVFSSMNKFFFEQNEETIWTFEDIYGKEYKKNFKKKYYGEEHNIKN